MNKRQSAPQQPHENPDRHEPFNIVYFERWADPIAEEILAAEPFVRLIRLTRGDSPATIAAAFNAAHGFQVTSARSDTIIAPDGALLARAPNLVAISTGGAGYDTVEVEACTAAGIIVVNQSGLNKQAVAEHVLGMMLCLSKRMIQSDRAMRRDRSWTRQNYVGEDIHGKTIGIIGVGNIGTLVAKSCASAFAMTVLGSDPYLTAEEMAARGARKVSLETLLGEADFVSVNCPLTKETNGMIGKRQFQMMKKSAFFIQTARGGIHDESDLVEALHEGRIAGAGIDVFMTEPPPLDHALHGFDNVLLTPHNAGVTRQAYRSMAEGAARQWLAILKGERPPRLLNPEAWPAFRERYQRFVGYQRVR
ncbi:MAG TPA: hydroxyacid dehydrogenase [Alphaproteobacteria bacterium]|nr:hydroxyacid dehydrogenase [Alphaproteobacteria bacterium]